ncbi:MAG: Rrf2 family transcriptional regulator [Bacteroidales bacterium]|nr:Rrf2 family transcriptional regulator [Bacteroidales bacterium]
MLSNASKYAIRAVLYLAVNDDKEKNIGIKQISKELKIPSPYLSKILQSLAKHKLLSSTKGPHGGFALRMLPEEISLMDIVKIIDGPDFFNTCLIGLKSCTEIEKDDVCQIHNKYAPIKNQLEKLFKEQTIESIIKGNT